MKSFKYNNFVLGDWPDRALEPCPVVGVLAGRQHRGQRGRGRDHPPVEDLAPAAKTEEKAGEVQPPSLHALTENKMNFTDTLLIFEILVLFSLFL